MVIRPKCDVYPKASYVDSSMTWTLFEHNNLDLVLDMHL